MLQLFRGCIALVGRDIDILVRQSSNLGIDTVAQSALQPNQSPCHITVVTKDELRTVSSRSSADAVLDKLRASLGSKTPQLHALGIGGYPRGKPDVLFVVVIWAKGQEMRANLGLPLKHFHITLSASDVHGIDKGVASLLTPMAGELSPDALDHLAYTLYLAGDILRAKDVAIRLCCNDPTSPKGFLRLGDIAYKAGELKLAMLAFARAFEHSAADDTKALDYCIRKICACADGTEWGTVVADLEMAQLPDEVSGVLLRSLPAPLRHKLCDCDAQRAPKLCREAREQLHIPSPPGHPTCQPFYRLPRFFRWLVPFYIALMSTPRDAADIAALASAHIGIRHVLTLTEETPLKSDWFVGTHVKNTYLPIPNYCPPTIEQMDLIIRLLHDEDNLPILIHCGGGKGRAGTVAACYLAAFGFRQIPRGHILTQPTMSATDAVQALRAVRPGSIETKQQEQFVGKWCSTIWKRRAVVADLVPEPLPCPLQIHGTLNPGSNFFILVGLPGAGKSWFAQALLARDASWTWISQDESGSRAACESAVGHAGGKGRVLLDRCNTSQEDRSAWLVLAAHWLQGAVCVWFDYDRELCTSRAQCRAGHPTLPPGGRVRSAVEQMHKAFSPPSLEEGFATVAVVRSFAAAEELVQRLSPPVTLFKFPRTAHLLNLGAATEDDIVQKSFPTLTAPETHVVITEKVDGANMGFSLSADGTQVVVQNRSHYVNTASHAQFKKLGAWVDAHRADLHAALGRDPFFPQRYVLFGEWLAATHSVAYTGLPDWFIAFDMYDRRTRCWLDRRTLSSVLAATGIGMVPVLYEGPMVSEQQLRDMVQGQSQFCEGRMEGVYVKTESGGEVVSRGKVVRGDFIAGNEHWTKGAIRLNTLSVHGGS